MPVGERSRVYVLLCGVVVALALWNASGSTGLRLALWLASAVVIGLIGLHAIRRNR